MLQYVPDDFWREKHLGLDGRLKKRGKPHRPLLQPDVSDGDRFIRVTAPESEPSTAGERN